MQAGKVREIEWAPPKPAPAFFVAGENPAEAYGPWQWAAAFGRATGGGLCRGLPGCRENATLRWQARASLWLSEVRQENAFRRACCLSGLPDRLSALWSAGAGLGQRRPKEIGHVGKVAVRRLLPPAATVRANARRSWTNAVGGCGRSGAWSHLDHPLARARRRGACAYANFPERWPSPAPTACGALASARQRARSARTQCLLGTTPTAHHGGFRCRIPRQQLTQEELANQEAFSMTGHLPVFADQEGQESLSAFSNLLPLLYCSLAYSSLRLPWGVLTCGLSPVGF